MRRGYRHADQGDRAVFAGRITRQWAVSSAVEHYVDIVVATGSIPVPPTIFAPPGSRKAARGHSEFQGAWLSAAMRTKPMKVRNSLRSLKSRHRDCQVVRRKGRIYVINKTNRRFKARQG